MNHRNTEAQSAFFERFLSIYEPSFKLFFKEVMEFRTLPKNEHMR